MIMLPKQPRVLLAYGAIQVPPALKAPKGNQDLKVFKANQAPKGLRGRLALRGPRARLDRKAPKGKLGPKGPRARLVLRVLRASLGLRVPKGKLGPKGPKAKQGLLAPLALRALLVPRWSPSPRNTISLHPKPSRQAAVGLQPRRPGCAGNISGLDLKSRTKTRIKQSTPPLSAIAPGSHPTIWRSRLRTLTLPSVF